MSTMDETTIVLVEYPHVTKSTWITASHSNSVILDFNGMYFSALLIPEHLTLKSLRDNLMVNNNGRIEWRFNEQQWGGDASSERTEYIFRVYLAAVVSNRDYVRFAEKALDPTVIGEVVKHINRPFIKHKTSIIGVRNITNFSKDPKDRRMKNLYETTNTTIELVPNLMLTRPRPGLAVIVYSRVTLVSGETYFGRGVDMPFFGLPIRVIDFMKRTDRSVACTFVQIEETTNSSSYLHEKQPVAAAVAPFMGNIEALVFDTEYDLPEDFVNTEVVEDDGRYRVQYHTHGILFVLRLVHRPSGTVQILSPELRNLNYVQLINTEDNIMDILCVMKRLKFYDTKVYSYGVHGRDSLGNTIDVGFTETLIQ